MSIADAADQCVARPLVPPRSLRREVGKVGGRPQDARPLQCVGMIYTVALVPGLSCHRIPIRVGGTDLLELRWQARRVAVGAARAGDGIGLNQLPPAA